jgi:hypothetical protein
MLSALRGPRGHALKVDQSLSDLIVKLKADCPGIQVCLDISLIWLDDRYKPYGSGSIYPLDADRKLTDT